MESMFHRLQLLFHTAQVIACKKETKDQMKWHEQEQNQNVNKESMQKKRRRSRRVKMDTINKIAFYTLEITWLFLVCGTWDIDIFILILFFIFVGSLSSNTQTIVKLAMISIYVHSHLISIQFFSGESTDFNGQFCQQRSNFSDRSRFDFLFHFVRVEKVEKITTHHSHFRICFVKIKLNQMKILL